MEAALLVIVLATIISNFNENYVWYEEGKSEDVIKLHVFRRSRDLLYKFLHNLCNTLRCCAK